MILEQDIRCVVAQSIAGTDVYLVDVTVRPGNEIEVEVDKPAGVSFDDCAKINRAIEASFDREVEDYEITVASPGLGQPLKAAQQYQKLLEKEVEVLLKSGEKLTATLINASAESIDISYSKKELVEKQKRKRPVTVEKNIAFADIKWVRAVVKV
jgi:ribosome maturation factor RimP